MQLGALHVPDEWILVDKFNSRVGSGKVSAYLRTLVERDLAGEVKKPDATNENILVELCERLRPELVPMLKTGLGLHSIQQPLLLGRILEQLGLALAEQALAQSAGGQPPAGSSPIVLMKILPEDIHSVQAAYAFKNISNNSEALAKLLNSVHPQNLAPSPTANTPPESEQELASYEEVMQTAKEKISALKAASKKQTPANHVSTHVSARDTQTNPRRAP